MYQRALICMNGQIDLGSISAKRYFAMVAIIAGLLFALIDNFPASFLGAIQHIIQWQMQTIIPMVFLYLVQSFLSRLKTFESLNPWVQLSVTAVVASTVFVPAALGIDVLFADASERFTLLELRDEYMAVLPAVTVCWLAINAPWVIGFRLVHNESVQKINSKTDEPEFYSLLPPEMRSELIYMTADLHYLTVITTAGKSMILYNLRDAIIELPTSIGIQTHRSYWVSLRHVKNFKRIGRQGTLELSNGDIIPVSRRNLSDVTKACSTV